MGIDYDNGAMVWMTTVIFTRWFQRFDTQIAQKPGQRVLLFIDGGSSYGTEVKLPILPHVRVEFLPKNTTTLVQTMNLGVIASIKKQYKQKVVEHASDLIERGKTDNIYNMYMRHWQCGFTRSGIVSKMTLSETVRGSLS